MPTFRHGKRTAVFLNGTDMSPFLNEATTTQEIETAETTTFGDNDKTYLVGIADGTISTSGLFDSTAGASDSVLNGLIGEEDNSITVCPEGVTAGNRAVLANGQLTSYEVSSPVSDVVSISAEIQADGGLYHGVVLAGNLSASATSQTTAIDNTTSTSNGALCSLHLTSNTHDGTTVVKVQHSADNISFVDLVTFSTVSASATAGETVTANGTVNRYLRAQYTLAGAAGNVQLTVAAARR